MLFISGR